MTKNNNGLKLIKLADFLPCNNKKFGCDYVAPRYTVLNYASLKEHTKQPDMFKFTHKKTGKQSRKLRTGFMTTGLDWYVMDTSNKKNVVGKTAPSRKAKKQIFKKKIVKKTRKRGL